MTPEEIQNLRLKHERDQHNYCRKCGIKSFDGNYGPKEYPCDVIKTLDALEELAEELQQIQEAWANTLEALEMLEAR